MGRRKAALSLSQRSLRVPLRPLPSAAVTVADDRTAKQSWWFLLGLKKRGDKADSQPQGGHPQKPFGAAFRFFRQRFGGPNLTSLDPVCQPCRWGWAPPLASVRTHACSVWISDAGARKAGWIKERLSNGSRGCLGCPAPRSWGRLRCIFGTAVQTPTDHAYVEWCIYCVEWNPKL